MRRLAVLALFAGCRSSEAPLVTIPKQPTVQSHDELAVPVAPPPDGEREPDPFVPGTERCGWIDPTNVKRDCEGDARVAPCKDATQCISCAALQHYKPSVAARALACVQALPVRDGCEPCAVQRCIDEARKSACEDATSTEACAKIGFKCRAVGMTECRFYLSGMTEAGRAKMVDCLATPAGCGVGIHACAERI